MDTWKFHFVNELHILVYFQTTWRFVCFFLLRNFEWSYFLHGLGLFYPDLVGTRDQLNLMLSEQE